MRDAGDRGVGKSRVMGRIMAQMAEKRSLLANPGIGDCVTLKGKGDSADVVRLRILSWGD